MTFTHGSTCYPPVSTPWGSVQTREELAYGIWFVSTAGHGGLWLQPDVYAQMPDSCKQTPYSTGGFYEEDCDLALVFAKFPAALDPRAPWTLADVHALLRSMRDYFTDQRLRDLGLDS